MKINSSFPFYSNQLNAPKNNTLQAETSGSMSREQTSMSKFSAYRDYNVSFGARLNRTPEDFYSQEFNRENMPKTVRDYLFEDYEERQHMPPAQLQREAFQWLELSDTVEDVKEMYPNEELFKDLKPFSQTNARRGTLLLLRWDNAISGTKIFIDDKKYKDPAMYLLKKIYLEGKTLKEINEDFEKDSTYAIRKELAYKGKDKSYFTYADLKSMGIKYPKLAYYQSFLATRNDKEYIPASRRVTERTYSQETREKMSETKKKWWAELSFTERKTQIQKMIEGKKLSDSVYAQYQGQIMTIVADKMGYSEKLSEMYAKRYSDLEFMSDYDTYNERQSNVMKEFWNKVPDFRQKVSEAIHDTMTDFEEAYNVRQDNPEKLQALLDKAYALKMQVLENAKLRKTPKVEIFEENKTPVDFKPTDAPADENNTKETSETQKATVYYSEYKKTSNDEKAVNKSGKSINFDDIDFESEESVMKVFKHMCKLQSKYCANEFQEKLYNFVVNHPDVKPEIIKGFLLFNTSDYQEVKLIEGADDIFTGKDAENAEKLVENVFKDVNDQFDTKYPVLAHANEFAMNLTLYELTKDPNMFKNTRTDSVVYIMDNNLEKEMSTKRNIINKRYKDFLIELSDKDCDKFYQEYFYDELKRVFFHGFKHHKDLEKQGVQNFLAEVFAGLRMEHLGEIEFMFNFVKTNRGVVKFINDKSNPQEVRDFVLEHMIYDFICARAMRKMREDAFRKAQD